MRLIDADALETHEQIEPLGNGKYEYVEVVYKDDIDNALTIEPQKWIPVPETGVEDVSDGYHTFRQLYYQRMMLFATIVKQNKDKAWKSLKHEDGKLCFDGGWFIVGIDTPKGSYTYHYETAYWSLFDCQELECGKHWDGHTEKDVTRLLSLTAQKWIPFHKRELTEEEQEMYPEWSYWLDCELPEDGDEILISSPTWGVYQDTFNNEGSDGCYLEGDEEIDDGMAWMPLPEPWKGEEECTLYFGF